MFPLGYLKRRNPWPGHLVLGLARSIRACSSGSVCRPSARHSAGCRCRQLARTPGVRIGPIDACTFFRICLQTRCMHSAGCRCWQLARTPGARVGPIDVCTFIRICLQPSTRHTAGCRCWQLARTPGARAGRSMCARSSGSVCRPGACIRQGAAAGSWPEYQIHGAAIAKSIGELTRSSERNKYAQIKKRDRYTGSNPFHSFFILFTPCFIETLDRNGSIS